MAVLGDHLAREARTDDPALVDALSGRSSDYRRLCTTAWKTGNFLRHLGVRSGARVGVRGEDPEAVLSFFGASLLGAAVEFDPDDGFDGRALVAPTDDLPAERPGTKRVGYGAEPDDPAVAHFERDVWSENPTMPPDRVAGEDDLLVAGGPAYTHGEVLEAARGVVERWGLGPGDEVAVRAPLSEAGTVAAGLVAPVVAGAVVLLPDDGTTGDFAVGDGPEAERVAPGDVL